MKMFPRFRLILVLSAVLQMNALANDFYPLRIGNAWFYGPINPQPGDPTGAVRVVGDSLFSNGLRYSVLSGPDVMGGRFVRSDSTSIFYFNTYTNQDERVIRCNSQVGDTAHIDWFGYYTVRLADIDTVLMFGIQLRVLTFELDGLSFAVLKFSERFGPKTEWRYADPGPPWPDWGRELVGCIIDSIHYGITVDVSDESLTSQSFELHQNYPNPFNPETHITYMVPSQGLASLRVFDVLGRDVRTLVHGIESPGHKSVVWDGRDNHDRPASTGVYFYELRTTSVRQVRRMLLLR